MYGNFSIEAAWIVLKSKIFIESFDITMYCLNHRYPEWRNTTTESVVMEMDGTFPLILVRCFVGVTSLLAKQATQLIMVSGKCYGKSVYIYHVFE